MVGTYAGLCLAAALGGLVNAVAGGGTLLTFPALLAALGSTPQAPVIANATSTLALVPGSLGGMWGYRQDLAGCGRWLGLLVGPSLAGGLCGSLAVVAWPDRFESLVPWLILAATLLFAWQGTLRRLVGWGRPTAPGGNRPWATLGVTLFHLGVAVYGGYFGAGIGILMLSGLALLGLTDVHQMNGIKTFLAAAINGVSAAVFIVSGQVHWPFALAMAAAAIAGGLAGAALARRLDRHLVRRGIVLIGLGLTAYYFWQR
jgi:hypothetical protein